jgi:sugar phosphate isomerase/epimerase
VKLGTVPSLIVVPEGQDQLKYRVNKAADVGLTVLGVFLNPDPTQVAYLESVAELAAKRGIELRAGTGANFYLSGAEAQVEIDRTAASLEFLSKHLGVRYSSLASGPMATHHRFAAGPPLEERKAAIARNLGTLADRVAPIGFTLALENHCDWRGHEIVDIVKAANRPNLKMQLDTGNAFSVFEDPVECARAMAPWVVSVHLKDLHVTPFASGEVRGTRAVSVPLGEGHVDNVAICGILQAQSANPAGIPLMLEPFYIPPGTDVTAFFNTSVAWAKKNLAPYLV